MRLLALDAEGWTSAIDGVGSNGNDGMHDYDNDIFHKSLNQIISENKPSNLRHCTFTLHKFQEKNLNLNRADISRGEFEGELE